MTEKNLHNVELTDEELGEIQGGYNYAHMGNNYYEYTGSDPDQKYLCPRCGRPVHKGWGWRFYCDPCDESWFVELALEPNLSSGAWTSISKEEYKSKTTDDSPGGLC